MIADLNQLIELFSGYTDAYGTYKLDTSAVAAGEKNVGRAATVRQPVTQKLWEMHLRGLVGLGIIPITNESKVKFGAIDIDVYPLNHEKLIDDIVKYKMPLVVCRTKSGGAHCYVFLNDWTSAKLVQTKLREMAGLLGYGTAEIFPKQTEILADRGDIGQWINMPYFNHSETQRFAYSQDKKVLTCAEFIEYGLKRRITSHQINAWRVDVAEELPGGPPCLQILVKNGFPKGTRNNGLFNIGVYAIKSDPDNWEKAIVDYNQKYMDPPLTPEEVMGVIKSLKKKEYNYSCDQHPIQPYCNASKCRTCKFGVGNGMGLPVLGTLTKLMTQPPIWFIDVDGGRRLELTTEQLQSPRSFQLVCMETLNMMPQMPKMEVWSAMIQKLMENVSVIEVSKDMSAVGQCIEWLDRFCTGRAQAKTLDEILLGKPWLNNGNHYFRISDFIAFLDRVRFKYDGMRWICKVLRDHGAQHKFFMVKGKGVNTWSIPEFKFMEGKMQTPDQREGEPPFA